MPTIGLIVPHNRHAHPSTTMADSDNYEMPTIGAIVPYNRHTHHGMTETDDDNGIATGAIVPRNCHACRGMTDICSIGSNTVDEAVNKDGFLVDVDIQSIEDTTQTRHTDKPTDVAAFFGKPHMTKSKDGKSCNVWDCDQCQYIMLPFVLIASPLIGISGSMVGPTSLSPTLPHAIVT